MISIEYKTIVVCYSVVLLSFVFSSDAFTVRRIGQNGAVPLATTARSLERAHADWPILEAKIIDFLLRLTQSNGTEFHFKDIVSVNSYGHRYNIMAKLIRDRQHGGEQLCNLVIDEEYAEQYAKMDVTCDREQWSVEKRFLLPGGLNEYDPEQLDDLQPLVIGAMQTANMDSIFELEEIKFAQVRTARNSDDGSTYLILADLHVIDAPDYKSICRIVVNDRLKDTLKIISFSCGSVLTVTGHSPRQSNNVIDYSNSSSSSDNQLDSADYV